MKVKPPFKNWMIFELCALILISIKIPSPLFQATSHNSEVSNFILLLSGAEVGEEWNLWPDFPPTHQRRVSHFYVAFLFGLLFTLASVSRFWAQVKEMWYACLHTSGRLKLDEFSQNFIHKVFTQVVHTQTSHEFYVYVCMYVLSMFGSHNW
jgi:hypothetical protein